MKTIAELQAIREKAREKMAVREGTDAETRVVVGLSLIHI